MAGIGFELKKLFVGSGVIRKMRAYAYAAVICSGTMILAVLLLLAVQAEARYFGISEHMREVLVVTMVYALFLSMLLSSGFQMYLSRYVADMMYQNRMDRVLPSLIGASLTLMIPGGILYGFAVSTAAELTLFQKILNWLLFTELIPVWLLMSYITAAKDYRAILVRFLAGVLTAILGGPLFRLLGVDPMTSLMLALTVGYGVMLAGMLRVLLRYFPSGRCSLLGYVAWFSQTPDLLLTGFLSMAGAFVHIILMWFSPLGAPVTGIFRQASLFDSAAFYAYLVTVPTNINFIVSVEVNFYTAYRRYFTAITDGGTMPDIRLARKQMERSMWQEINSLIVVQIFAMVLYMLFMRYFLSAIGFTADMLHMFRLMCIGYSLYCIGISLMMLQLYFNDRKGAMASAAAFFVFNAVGTLVSLRFGTLFYGAGVIVGGLAMYLVSFPRLNRYVKRIDYNVYCTQPVFNEITHDFWKELAARLEARAARRRNPDEAEKGSK